MRRIFMAVTMVSALLAAPLARAETLADALIAAYRNSNLLDQNRAVLRAADEDVAVAVSSLRPVVSFSTQARWSNDESRFGDSWPGDSLDASLALTAEMTLYDFGRSQIAIEAAKESVLATREALVRVEQEVLLDAVAAFVNVRLAIEIVDLRQSNLRLITQELRAAEDRFEVGEITRTDVAIAEARLAESRALLATAEGDLMVAREAYKAATGNYPGTLAPLPPTPATARTLDEARAVALRTHPIIRQSQFQVNVANLNVDRAKAEMRPTVRGGVTLQRSFDGLDRDGSVPGGLDGQSASVTLSQTLYAGGRLSALLRRAHAGKEQASAALAQNGVLVAENVANAWTNILVTTANIEASQRQITAAQTAFDGVREEATLGARTTLDVLDAEQELLDARAARLRAEAQRYVGVYSLLSSMGLLTVDHLQLGIPTYDPAAYYNAVRKAPAHSAQGKKLDRILKSIGN